MEYEIKYRVEEVDEDGEPLTIAQEHYDEDGNHVFDIVESL